MSHRSRPLWKTLLKNAAFAGTLAYAGLAVIGCTSVDGMIFPAPRPSYDTTLPGLVAIPAAGKTTPNVAGLWIPQAGATTAILYLHGNGEDIGHDRALLREIGDATGCSVLGIDYPGYGLTGGKASEDGCYCATEAAFAALQKEYGYTPGQIVVMGRSVGTGPAVDLASKREIKGLVLVSPYTSTFRVVTHYGFLPFDRFDNLAKIDAVRRPLLIIHGDRDGVIPFAHGEELFKAAENASPKYFLRIPGAGHNEGMPGPAHEAEFYEAIRKITGP